MGIVRKILEGKLKEAEEELGGELDSKKDEVMKEARSFTAKQILKQVSESAKAKPGEAKR